MGSGEIPDERISASSVYRAAKSLFNPWMARAHARPVTPGAGGWRPARDAAGEYLQVDLEREYELTALATQGAAYSENWVTKYKFLYSRDNVAWRQYPGELPGNADSETVKVVDLHERVLARYVRVAPLAWSGHIGLRLEVYGFSPECAANEEERVVGVPCAKSANAVAAAHMGEGEGEANVLKPAPERKYAKGFPLGLEAGGIPDGSFSASSVYVPRKFFAGTDALPACKAMHAALRARASKRGAKASAASAGADEEEATLLELAADAEEPATEGNAAAEQAEARFAAASAAASATGAAAAGAAAGAKAEPLASDPHGKPDCGIKTSYAAHYARLNELPSPYKSGGWRPSRDAAGEYLQIDLGSLQEVDAVLTQGRAASKQWVTAFRLDYSSNGRQWESVPTEFSANSDEETPVKHVLPRPLLTRYLRVVVKNWNRGKGGGIGLRAEVYGPGKGSGCMLRCFAANLARNSGGSALDNQLAVANGAAAPGSFLELGAEAAADARVEASVAALAELAVAADAEVSGLVSCCGCPCCDSVDPGACKKAGGARKAAAPAAKAAAPQQTLAAGGATAANAASPAIDSASNAAIADTVRILLRGKGREGKAFGSDNARNMAEAQDQPVAAAVTVPSSGKTFYVVQKE